LTQGDVGPAEPGGRIPPITASRPIVQPDCPALPQRIGLAALLAAAVDEDQGGQRSLQVSGQCRPVASAGW
jgi:hypothetical protein